jgi:hypothetical protein
MRGGSVPLYSNINASDNGYTSMSGLTYVQNRSMEPSPISLDIHKCSPGRVVMPSSTALAKEQTALKQAPSQVQMYNECSHRQSVNIQSEENRQMLSDPHILSNGNSSPQEKQLQQTLNEIKKHQFPSMF